LLIPFVVANKEGENGQTEIVKKAKASPNSISKYWQKWEK